MNKQPAFPTIGDNWNRSSGGMTLRDYFAAKAMQGLLSGQFTVDSQTGQPLDYDQRAVSSYKQADAMLKAREK
jgi:hypothetical protein